MALIDYVMRRGENLPVDIHVAGALTKGMSGEVMTEIGLMQDVGAVMFASGKTPIRDAQMMRRYCPIPRALMPSSLITVSRPNCPTAQSRMRVISPLALVLHPRRPCLSV